MTNSVQNTMTPRPSGEEPAGAKQNTYKIKQLYSAICVGIIDCSVVLSYLLGFAPDKWHVITLVLKFSLLMLTFRSSRESLLRPALPLVLVMSALVASSFPSADYDFSQLSKSLGFLIHITLTTLLVEKSQAYSYLKAAALTISAAAFVHVATCILGTTPARYGRFFYLGGGHPNLGGEINAMGALAAALALRKYWLIGCLVVVVASDVLMQSRASLIVILAISLCSIVMYDRSARAPLQRAGILLIAAMCLAPFLITSGAFTFVGSSVSDLLLLNDSHRGLDTGFVGRDARWAFSFGLIEQHPFFGVGAGYFDANNHPTPHNFFLYAIAENGILGGSAIISVMAIYFWRALRHHFFQGSLVFMAIPLLVFNDRFMNLNPYPFIFFITLIITGAGRSPERIDLRRYGNGRTMTEKSYSRDL